MHVDLKLGVFGVDSWCQLGESLKVIIMSNKSMLKLVPNSAIVKLKRGATAMYT